MKQIIKFTDANVDGNGSNIDTLVQVEGRFPLTHGIVQRVEKAIEQYKNDNDNEWTTNDIVDAACKQLELEGYMCDSIIEDVSIEF